MNEEIYPATTTSWFPNFAKVAKYNISLSNEEVAMVGNALVY